MKEKTLAKLSTKEAAVGIVGLGYVGLPLALTYCRAGFKVVGFDTDESKIKKINAGETYIEYLSSDDLKEYVSSGFRATSSFEEAAAVDAIIICVPTPLNKHREPDLSFIESTLDSIKPYLRSGHIISLESTTYPGTTEEIILPVLEAAGFEVGRDIYLIYSPEREDPGNVKYNTRNIPKIVGGYTANCLSVGVLLYELALDTVVAVSSTKAAEMTKLLENIHRAVNIGLVNEMKILADKMGIDIHEVIRGASTKPFGFTAYYPGPGLGGHCIPIDPFYLTWKAREYGLNTRFIELAGEVNTSMPSWVIGKVADALNDRGKAIKGARVLVLGIAYKKNVDDMRESPAVELMEQLMSKGAEVKYSDPHVPVFPKMRKYNFDLSSITLTPEEIGRYDCVLLATDHDAFDYSLILESAVLIVDSRGVYVDTHENVVKA